MRDFRFGSTIFGEAKARFLEAKARFRKLKSKSGRQAARIIGVKQRNQKRKKKRKKDRKKKGRKKEDFF